MPWVLTRLGQGLYAFNCASVREMVIMPEVSQVPGVPAYIRGVLNLRGRVSPVVDLRLRLGMRSSLEEAESLCTIMEQREQDHRRWLEELTACVKESRKFTLAIDPHQCAFGKWYDTFHTDDIMLSSVLRKFDAPHKRLHALAAEVQSMVQLGHGEQAVAMLEEARTGVLDAMLRLFAEFRQLVRDNQREIAVVLNGPAGVYAVSVDSVASVERLAEADTEVLGDVLQEQRSAIVTSVAKRAKEQDLVLIVAPDSILDAAIQSQVLQAPPTA